MLVAHLLKWSAQPDRRSKSREKTVAYRRGEVLDHLADVPSLRSSLSDPEWAGRVWLKAVALAEAETGLETSDFPVVSPWAVKQVLSRDFLPSERSQPLKQIAAGRARGRSKRLIGLDHVAADGPAVHLVRAVDQALRADVGVPGG